jgi:hypothetical protein
MTAVYLFAVLLALLVVMGLVASPLLEQDPVDEEDASAAERRDAEIETLQEVEFEYRTGKLSEEDYRELRSRHAEAAVRARREAAGEEGVPEEEPDLPRCSACGARARRTGARFCSECGSELEAPGG